MDYQLWYDNASGTTYQVFEASIATTEFIATGLTQGSTYKFRVEARNAYGTSFMSNEVEILAAQIPF